MKFSERAFSIATARCLPSLEPAANRTQVDAFHASFQALFENVLVPDCLLQLAIDWTKLDSEIRHRSSYRRRTKSTGDFIYVNLRV